MKRSQATDLIDRLRCVATDALAANTDEARLKIRNRLLAAFEESGLPPLEPCGGEAHSNAFIDNCMRCVPRWGHVGKKEPVT